MLKGGTEKTRGKALASSADGSIIITGAFSGTAAFGLQEAGRKTLTSLGGTDIFPARYQADGTLTWVKHAGGMQDDTTEDVQVDSAGRIIVTGSFTGTATFGLGEVGQRTLTTFGMSDLFIACYRVDGRLSWAKRGGSREEDRYKSAIGILPDNSIMVVGTFIWDINFSGGSGGLSAGLSDCFMAYFRSDGGYAWCSKIGTNSVEGGTDIAVMADGSV